MSETKTETKTVTITKLPVELSDEDKVLKEEIDNYAASLGKSTDEVCHLAVDALKKMIISSTKSMTSVPKPLKFLGSHYDEMKRLFGTMREGELKKKLSDILSIVAIVKSDQEDFAHDTLQFRFLGCLEDIETWGHEYIRHLTSQIVSMWHAKELVYEKCCENDFKETSESLKERCLSLVHKIIPYYMKHNAETEAIDLSIELELLELIATYCTKSNYDRVCLYMAKTVLYLSEPDNRKLLEATAKIYEKFGDLGNAIKCALRLNDSAYAEKILFESKDSAVQKQLTFLLARQQYKIPYDTLANYNVEKLMDIVSNMRLSEYFRVLGRELDIMDPKVPEDIYKSHLEPSRPSLGSTNIDSAKNNLASSYVSGLVNCGFGKDKLLLGDDTKWVYKNKEMGMMSAVGTLGWVLLWDVDEGLSQIDRYLYSDDDYIRAGGLLACGVVNCGVKNECDPALALLTDYIALTGNKPLFSRASIIGLGIAYAGTMKDEVISQLTPIIRNTQDEHFELSCLAALSCGLVGVSSMDSDIITVIVETMIERPQKQWSSPFSRFMALGLGLILLGKQEETDVVLVSLEAAPEPIKSLAHLMCDICAYAGSGSVLKVQSLLHILSEKALDESSTKDKEKEKEKEKEKDPESKSDKEASSFDYLPHQGLAALGIGLVSAGDPVGQEMGFRVLGRLLRFGEIGIKRAVPLALSLMWTSDPQMRVLDTLGKFSHDSDMEMAFSAILSLGLVGAGTNHARLAAMLRQLASYHAKEPNCLLAVRLAQGLLHLGKGTLTISPRHQEGFLTSPASLGGLLCVLVACLDVKRTFVNKHDSLLFYLTPAIQPRLLMTFDEQLSPLTVSVRVGQRVDTVGQAGRPKTITGFQTHTTPVLLAAGERAELSTDEYLPVSQLPMEGFVVLRKNPNYEKETDKQ